MMYTLLDFVNVLQERHEDEGNVEDVRTVGGEDEEECKVVVEMNMSYEMQYVL